MVKPNWPTCRAAPDCQGIRISGHACLAHLTGADLGRALDAIHPGADIDMRGVPFTPELLNVVLRALSEPDSGPRFGRAQFQGARFPQVDFTAVEFTGACSFSGAVFTETATFDCTFGADVWFGPSSPELFKGATFAKSAWFHNVVFSGDAHFGGTRLVPQGVEFDQRASFLGCEFQKAADWNGVSFGRQTRFDDALFNEGAQFSGARFSGDVTFADSTFVAAADFRKVTFAAPEGTQLGPFTARELDLREIRSHGPLTIRCGGLTKITAANVQCAGNLNLQLDGDITIDASAIRSAGDLTLTYQEGDLTLTGAAFDTPSTISSPDPLSTPRLLALEKVDATNLTLALTGLRLTACRFKDCHNRDKLRIEGPLRFASTPDHGLWTNRYVLAEEHKWRATFDRRPSGWFPGRCRRPNEAPPAPAGHGRTSRAARDEAAQIQSIYRDLRKGREDAKDEPGASDFYFGEMEMRRMAAAQRSWERVLLTAYWAVSGYGLRATRALATLTLVLALATLGFATIGFAPSTQTAYQPVTTTPPIAYRQVSQPGPKPGWVAAIDQSVDSATALLRQNTPRPLTTTGRVIEILLRLLGPLLLGLAVLALRNRVKR